MCGAETWTLGIGDHKYLENFEMWCWRRTEKICWTDHLRKKGVHYINKRGRLSGLVTTCARNCPPKYVTEKTDRGKDGNGIEARKKTQVATG